MDGVPLRHTLRSTNNRENDVTRWKKGEREKRVKTKKEPRVKGKMEELKQKYGDFTLWGVHKFWLLLFGFEFIILTEQ